MFNVTLNDINAILRDYCFRSPATSFSELQRYHYEKKDPDSKEVRLIIKVELCADKPVVIRFKNESDVTLELMEEQSKFAAILRQNGIEVPKQYKTEDGYARWYSIDTYEVIVTVEQFVEGELHCVDVETALETGRLLAKMHNIAERLDVHIENDLFAFSAFRDNSHVLSDVDAPLYAIIHAFWSQDIKWNDNSLLHAIEKGQVEDVRRWLKEIHRRIHHIQPIAL